MMSKHAAVFVLLFAGACAEPMRSIVGAGDAALLDVRVDAPSSDAAVSDNTVRSDTALDVRIDAFRDSGSDVATDSATTPSSAALSAPAESDEFGSSIALSEDGNTLVVGDWSGGPGGVGAAFIYTRSGATWNAGTALPLPASVAAFGTSVSISDDGSVVVVGDWNGGDEGGRAYVYVASDNYATATPLNPPSGASDFGWSVSVSGDGNTVAVGDYNSSDVGRVSIYSRSSNVWSAGFTLAGPTGSAGFGDDVALARNGNTLVVGDTNGGGDGNGAATVFSRTNGTWNEGTALTRPAGTASFGYSVAINRDATVIAVGDPSGGGDTFGSVTFYRNTNGTWASIEVPRPPLARAFGGAVRVSNSGSVLLVGDFEGDTTGAAHAFSIDSNLVWSQIALRRPTMSRGFGRGVAMSGDGRFVAVSDQDGGNAERGEVLFFGL